MYFVDYREAAALMNISVRTLRRLVEAGAIPAPRRFRNAVRFDVGELREAVQRLPRAGASE